MAERTTRRQTLPDESGYFGAYGGQFLPPQLEAPFAEITKAYHEIENDAAFIEELRRIRKHFQGRPTPAYHAARLSQKLGGTQIYLKREDLNHTGAHKLNHCMGEGLLARYMGKKKLIAETGAGQHGVALATAAAYFGLECDIYMGEVDIAKQAPNVARMQILGRPVIPVTHGLKTLKEAVDSAFVAYMAGPREPDLLHRLGGRPASVPDDGAGFPTRRRHRGARAVPRNDGQPAGHRHRLRRRRQQRDGHVRRLPRRSGASSTASNRSATAPRSASTRPP